MAQTNFTKPEQKNAQNLGQTYFTETGSKNLQIQRFEELPTFDLAERRWTYTRTKPDSAATIDNSDDGYPEARRCHGTVQVEIVEIVRIAKIMEIVEIF